jgi:hypothetical protein
MPQDWNDVLTYIKNYLSSDINQLEISDTELIEHLKKTALRTISIYHSYHYWYTLDETKLIDENISLFEIRYDELPANTEVVKIIEFAPKTINETTIIQPPETSIDFENILSYAFNELDYLNSVNLLPELVGTKYIKFDQDWKNIKFFFPAKIKLGLTYPRLDLMQFELYELYFKPLCLAETKILLGERRSKFANLTTPSGQIQLRAIELKQEGIQEKQYILQRLEGEIDYQPIYLL